MPHTKMDLKGTVHPATVYDNNDPDKAGKVKVRVPGVDDGITDAQLPWAIPVMPYGTGVFSGLSIPPVGSGVFILFPVEDTHYRYMVGVSNMGVSKQIQHLIGDYPNGYVSIDAMGVTTVVNTIKRTYTVGFPDGSGFQWHDGDIEVSTPKSVKVSAGQDMVLQAGNSMSLITNDLSLNGQKVQVAGNSILMDGPVTQKGSGSPKTLNLNVGNIPHSDPVYPPQFTQKDREQTIMPDADSLG